MTVPTGPLQISCPVHACEGWARMVGNADGGKGQTCVECSAWFQVPVPQVPASGTASAQVSLLRLQTYEQEYVEVRLEEVFVIRVVGRLDLSASELLAKAWQSLPTPRRALIDLAQTTEQTLRGIEAVLDLCARLAEDDRAVLLIHEESPEKDCPFTGHPRVHRSKEAALVDLGEIPDSSRQHLTVAIRRDEVVAPSGPLQGKSTQSSPRAEQGSTVQSRRRLEVEDIGDVTVVSFIDKKILDEQNIQLIGDQLFRLVDEEGRRKILLNFGNVEYLSSMANGKLITLHYKVKAAGGRLVLCNIPADIYEVFEITRLNRFFVICSDEQEGLQSF
jgi:anti-sigma B factor antagonist